MKQSITNVDKLTFVIFMQVRQYKDGTICYQGSFP